jgi:ketosteroid isomerase-like protein
MSDVVDRLAAQLNAHNPDGMAALFHPDYRSEQPAHPARAFTGRSQMHANWQAILGGITDFHGDMVRSVDDGDVTWTEWHWTGTSPDGSPFEVRGVTLFEVQDGQITSGRLYMEDVEGAGIAETVKEWAGREPDQPAE